MKSNMITALLAATFLSCWTMVGRAEVFNKESYVDSVIGVLRFHADAISNLSTYEIKYSDNLVRHAVGLQRTFGLLGPMDWHAADSAKLMNKEAANLSMDEEQFDKLEWRSRRAMKALVAAAQDTMVEDNREGLEEALEDVKESCNACHFYLPESVAPDVWGTLKGK